MFNTDLSGNVYFPAGVSVGNYPITLNTPTHVLVAGAGGFISKVATSQLISNTDVTSVFGRQGAIIARPGDYTSDMVKEITNLYFTNERARAAISVTAVGTTGPATYNALTGVINIPQYQNDFSGVTTFNTRTGAVTLTALDVTTALTYTPIAVETDPVWAAQKVLYYTKVESDATFAAVSHTHTITNITGLQTALDAKEPSITAGTTSQYWRGDKTWQTLPTYTLPTASTTVLGGVKVDGTTITINGSGVISGANTYTLPTASATVLGGIKVGTNLSIDANGVLSSTDTNTTYANFTRTVAGLVPNPGGATTNRYLREDGTWVIPPDTDTNTWNANSVNVAGYVAAPGAVANKVWKTDGAGNPAWRDDADTTYTLAGLGGLALSGGTMTGAIILKEGAANGLKFPNDVFGGSGDTAGIRLITRSGESMSLEVYLTNDADDWFNISVPSGDGAKVNGNTIWHAGNLTNLNQLSNGPGYLTSLSGAVLTTYNSSLNSDSRNSRGVTRLYRRDDDSDYSVQAYWTGSHWFIRGYNGDTFHAEARVGYSDSTGSVAWGNVSGRPTALSQFSNDLGNYGNWLARTGDSMSGRLTINTTGTDNTPLLLYAVEPYIQINAQGASNTAGFRIYPTEGYNALIGNYTSGQLVLVAGNTESVYITSNSLRVAKYRFNGNTTLSGNGTPEIVDMANVGMAMQSLNYRWYNNAASVIMMTLDSSGNLTANAFYESSDIRYKNVIETNPSLTLEGLDVIKFTRKGSSTIRYGYSAQQVKSLSEDLIGGTKDEMTVNYSDIHTLKIAALEKRIAELEAKLN